MPKDFTAKIPTGMKYILCRQNSSISRLVPPASLLNVATGYCQRAVADESGVISIQMGTQNRSEWSQCMGRLVRYHPLVVTFFIFVYLIQSEAHLTEGHVWLFKCIFCNTLNKV
jgi:hypothetical protein